MKVASKLRGHAVEIFYHALQAVDPAKLLKERLRLDGRLLTVDGKLYNLEQFKGIYALGFGKASAPMAQALEDILGERLDGGIMVVTEGYSSPLRKLQVLESSHPVPDDRSQKAASKLLEWAKGLGDKSLVFCLVSGGASALLCAPPEGITVEDFSVVTSLLLASGAEIREMNTLRKHLSLIHGGRLARALYPATVVNLVISDVVGDALDVISSGPTLPDPSTFQEALNVVAKYGFRGYLSDRVFVYLERGAMGAVEETPKEWDDCFQYVDTFLIGNNVKALELAKEKARGLGYNTSILSSSCKGEAKEVAKVFSSVVRECRRTGNPISPPACLLAGGETTVTIKGGGKGGRNQEFALACAIEVEGLDEVVVLSGGTDGNDGPTNVAGAVVDGSTCQRAKELGMQPLDFLFRNDSYAFFFRMGDHIITGPTRTNVMDIMLALIGNP